MSVSSLVKETDFAKECGLEVVYSSDKGMKIASLNINRPSFLLAGYSDHFSNLCVQVLGRNEMTYLGKLDKKLRKQRTDCLFSSNIPCVVVTRGMEIYDEIKESAKENDVPVFLSYKTTADLSFDLLGYLKGLLAPTTSIHAVLLDVFGVGILLTGNSGIGKSETALELIHRGHRLISDDIVELKEIDNELHGKSPQITQNMLEIRGLGIIDVKAVFGVGAVLERKKVSIVIELEKWDDNKVYNRIGNIELKEDILGVSLPKHIIPVMPGRNLAIIIEVAVRDFRLKEEGYYALDIIDRRMN